MVSLDHSFLGFLFFYHIKQHCIVAVYLVLEDVLRENHTMLNPTLVDNRKERVQFDKITARVSRLCYGLDADHVDAAAITQKVISGVYQGVTTIELDNLVSRSRHRDKPWTYMLISSCS